MVYKSGSITEKRKEYLFAHVDQRYYYDIYLLVWETDNAGDWELFWLDCACGSAYYSDI